jgi:hypothetical protein
MEGAEGVEMEMEISDMGMKKQGIKVTVEQRPCHSTEMELDDRETKIAAQTNATTLVVDALLTYVVHLFSFYQETALLSPAVSLLFSPLQGLIIVRHYSVLAA